MNKRGQGLPLNTLIIIILVVIVLIVVALFFLGGTSNLSRSIRGIFYGTTAGTDLNLAIEQCRNHCGNAQSLPDNSLTLRTSGYCRQTYSIDKNGDGKITTEDDPWVKVHCWQEPISITCVGVKETIGGGDCPDTSGTGWIVPAGTGVGAASQWPNCAAAGGDCKSSCSSSNNLGTFDCPGDKSICCRQ